MLTSDHSRVPRPHIPSSTYRVQLNSSFTFQHAADLVDYLDGLGIGTCYVSPVLTARSGSPHGYDVIDHSRLNPDIGTDEQFCEFALRLRDRGMGLLLDVVPNHMCVDTGNAWWWDCLENGPGSPYAHYFDIDWNPPKEELAGKVLLPVLGDQYGRVLESQGLQIVYESGAFWAMLGETRLPLAPQSWRLILEPALAQLRHL